MAKQPQSSNEESPALATMQKHDDNIQLLQKKLDEIEDKLSNPAKFAELFETNSKDSKSLDRLFSKLFCDLLNKDDGVKKAFIEQINSLDRNFFYVNLKRWWVIIGGFILIFAGEIVRALINYWLPPAK